MQMFIEEVETNDEETAEDLSEEQTEDAPDTTQTETDAPEAEVEADDDTSGDDGDADGADNDADDDRKSRAKSQIDRLKSEIKTLKEQVAAKGDSAAETKGLNPDLINRTFLATKGYTEKAAQDKVIDLAKKNGMTVDAALEDPDIKSLADGAQKRAIASKAAARPAGKGGATKRDAKWHADNNVMPEDPKMRADVFAILADREKR